MDVDLAALAKAVRDSLNAYAFPEHGPDALGQPRSGQWYEAGLAEMRASLVSPYWIEMRDLDPGSGKLAILTVAVVADPSDTSFVAFDPSLDGEFVVGMRELDPDRDRGIDAVSCGVRGDAVDCFLSR